MWRCYSFKAPISSTLVPLIKLEQRQNYIHWFSLNEKDFRVTQEDNALSGHFQRYPHPDCSGKLNDVSSSVWAAARWGWLYYIYIYFPQHLSNFSQARLMACSVSDNLKLRGGPLYGIRRDYELHLLRKWTVCPNAMSQPLLCSLFQTVALTKMYIVSVYTTQGQLAKYNYGAIWEYYLNWLYFTIWILSAPPKNWTLQPSPGNCIHFLFFHHNYPTLLLLSSTFIAPTFHLFFHNAIQLIHNVHLSCMKVTDKRIYMTCMNPFYKYKVTFLSICS